VPYLGKVVSEPSSWTPLQRYRAYFLENSEARPDFEDPWQFTNFLFRP